MTTVEIVSQIKNIFEKMAVSYEAIQWVKCPVCKEEWTRLQQVLFFTKTNEGVKRNTAYTCPDCSKSVFSAEWFVANFGLLFDTNATILKHPAYFNFANEKTPISAYYVKIYDGRIITTRGDRVLVYQEKSDFRSFDNIAQAIVSLSESLNDKPKIEEAWA